MPVEYQLKRPAAAPARPVALDDSQQAVLQHVRDVGGPLQVLAGPGAGKTTTLVELVADRVETAGLAAEEILVLTFSRKAAQELRARIAARLDRTTATCPAMTFHSFCYALLRAEQDASSFADPLRLLSAPEQDAAITELLAGTDPALWPPQLRPALRTRGMAGELQRLLGSARSAGLDSLDLVELGGSAGRADWSAAGHFFDELTSVAALAGTIDHTDLIFQAVRQLGDPDTRSRWRERLRLVVVDEYQDTDPLQVALLHALAGGGPDLGPPRDLVVVGDPYQSIYGFRGADVRGILDFPDTFGDAQGEPARRLVLSCTNRYGPTIADAVRSIVHNRGALAAADSRALEQLRSPRSTLDEPGEVRVETFTSATAEAESIALLLREQHLHEQRPWRDMAVLVRSSDHLRRLQRALQSAGVPVDVAGDELPLALEPAVRTLVAALKTADRLHEGQTLDPAVAESLLTGPLGGLDAGSLRRLGRLLRRRDDERWPRPSRVLVAEALTEPVLLEGLQADGPAATAVRSAAAVARLLAEAARQIEAGSSAEEVLWTLWDGTDWPRRLRQEAESDGEGSARAHHDLDALCALFAEATRAEEKQARRSVTEVVAALEAQQIPADTLAQAADSGQAVQLMTAHRSKGLQWPLVVVAGVQEGQWPDVRLRSSLLQPERLGPGQVLPPPSARAAVAEERRLFYVACTRARSLLMVTAVQATSADGEQPSRLLAELQRHVEQTTGSEPATPRGRPQRSLSLRGAVARLRRLGETTDDPHVRQRAAALLARIADHPAGRPAHPDRWWGLAERTRSDVPVRSSDEPLRLSGSQVSALVSCPLQWFLEHEARGGRGTTQSQGFGSVVHAIAADVVEQGVDPDPDELARHLDDVWGQLDYAPWIGRREKAAAVEAITRFARWHRDNPRTVLAAEHRFDVEVQVQGRSVRLSGSMDRVEVDDEGGVHVVDLKTGKSLPSGAQITEHAQLGIYQVAVEHGAVPQAPGAPAAGAELVQLRHELARAPGQPRVQAQAGPGADEPFFSLEQLRHSVHTIDTENFVAVADEQGACTFCAFSALCPTKDAGISILGRTDGQEDA
ncbi:ATP-dependent helicase [Aeromicrobium sp. CTD01-1L150]|uniref:ATP-dependent helicase n=1 Tax=Aeromicrobium sp. CTD01-1L150 TaxID=3341830 RepID=UPI0035C0F431